MATTTTLKPDIPTFEWFELAFDWIREINHPAQFIIAAGGTNTGQAELWKGYPSGRGERIRTMETWHLTRDGQATLCGSSLANRIHVQYAGRELDSGKWCSACQHEYALDLEL